MYGLGEYELWRQRYQEIHREVTAARLARVARADRRKRSHLVRGLKWELARSGELLCKRLRNVR